MRELGKLTTTKIASLKEPGRYHDGAGLYLAISRWRTRSWLFRYQLAGRSRDMGLGSAEVVGLKDAREKARAARLLLIDGVDPIDVRLAKKQALASERAKRMNFKEAAETYIAAHKEQWKNEKHKAQWRSTLATYAYPVIGNVAVGDVDTPHMTKILEPIWTTIPDTASRLRGRIESVLNWAKTRELRKGENCARWKGHLENVFPEKSKVRKVRHQPAMPFSEVPGFMVELRGRQSISARALEVLILTAALTGEVIYARWPEFDLAKGLWTVPGDRMKSGREHRVPLPARVVEILKSLPREKGSDFVFPGGKQKKPLSSMALLMLLRGMRASGCVPHGFRSSFRDFVGEATSFPREVAEAALGHVIRDASEAAYRRGDALAKRAKMMEAWAKFCAAPAKDAASNVTEIRKVA